MERGAKGEKQFAISITGSTYLRAGLALFFSLVLSRSLLRVSPDPANGVSPDRVARFLDDSRVLATGSECPYTVKDIISCPKFC